MIRAASIAAAVVMLASAARAGWTSGAWDYGSWHGTETMRDLWHAFDERAAAVGERAWDYGVELPGSNGWAIHIETNAWTWSSNEVATSWVWRVSTGTNVLGAGTDRTERAAAWHAGRYPTGATTNIAATNLTWWYGGIATSSRVDNSSATWQGGPYASATAASNHRDHVWAYTWHSQAWLTRFDYALAALCGKYVNPTGNVTETSDPAWTFDALLIAALGTNDFMRAQGGWARSLTPRLLDPSSGAVSNLVALGDFVLDAADPRIEWTTNESWVLTAPPFESRLWVPTNGVTVTSDCVIVAVTNMIYPYIASLNDPEWQSACDDGTTPNYSNWIGTVTGSVKLIEAWNVHKYTGASTGYWAVATNWCGSQWTIWHSIEQMRQRRAVVSALVATVTNGGWSGVSESIYDMGGAEITNAWGFGTNGMPQSPASFTLHEYNRARGYYLWQKYRGAGTPGVANVVTPEWRTNAVGPTNVEWWAGEHYPPIPAMLTTELEVNSAFEGVCIEFHQWPGEGFPDWLWDEYGPDPTSAEKAELLPLFLSQADTDGGSPDIGAWGLLGTSFSTSAVLGFVTGDLIEGTFETHVLSDFLASGSYVGGLTNVYMGARPGGFSRPSKNVDTWDIGPDPKPSWSAVLDGIRGWQMKQRVKARVWWNFEYR